MKNGEIVAAFEREFAQYVGAKYAIALVNGTATLHTALVALGVKPGYRVAVPPLTMASTTIAVLHAGGVPVFVDVDPGTWLIVPHPADEVYVPVDLYGLNVRTGSLNFRDGKQRRVVYDSAQTLYRAGKYDGQHTHSFRSYSFQASKILALGEGGMLVTDDEELAVRAREFSSLGYRMRADQPRIDPATLKSPTFGRHHRLGQNYRMNDVTAGYGLAAFEGSETPTRHVPPAYLIHLNGLDGLLYRRREAAAMYRDAIAGCTWLTPQHVPEGWTHDYWTYAVALDVAERWEPLSQAIVRYGGERPYAAWRLTYQEPAFRHLAPDGTCPVAEALQPRLLQLQTNDLASAERNARALKQAIAELE